jgi:predicted nucleic-acid-binding Zn-ribbon protein
MSACPKCNGEMEPGYCGLANWTPVASEASSKGRFMSYLDELQNKMSIDGFRCAKCGFLELYAK